MARSLPPLLASAALLGLIGLLCALGPARAAADDEPLAVWRGDRIVLLRPIEFEIDRERIRPASMPLIQEIRDRLEERPEARIEIQAHNDPDWVCEHCARRLTRDRAEAIRQALIHLGVAPERLTAQGYEGSRPLRLCRPIRGRRQRRACQLENRRVELHLIAPR